MKYSFHGNNVIIVNGKVISSGNFSDANSKKIEEQKSVNAIGISRIDVDCDFGDIQMNVSDTDSVSAHLYGEVITEGSLKFDVSSSADLIKIKAKFTGSQICGTLKLQIDIPTKMFEEIHANSESGRITISKGVKSERFNLKTMNGMIESYATFKELKALTMNGREKINVDANSDVYLDVSTMNGRIEIKLHNISNCQLSASSMNGTVKRSCQRAIDGFTAYGKVSTMNGRVSIE